MNRLMFPGAVMLCLLLAAPAHTADLFEVLAETTDGGTPVSIRIGDSSLIDLVEDVVEREGEFRDLENRDFTASITYGGVRDAVVVDVNADATEAVLRFPPTGFERTFTGADEDELRDEIEDFIIEDGSEQYARFLQAMNERSLVAIVDGNPSSTTALFSRQSFGRFGFGDIFRDRPDAMTGSMGQGGGGEAVEGEASTVSEGGGRWSRVEGIGDFLDADGFEGFSAGVELSTGWRFTENFGLVISSPFVYRDIEGASAFHGGIELGLPIRILHGRSIGDPEGWGEADLSWTVTPLGLVAAGGSIDMAAGGLMGGGGVASQVRLDFDRLEVTVGNQITFFEGFPISFSEYEFDTDVSQQVLVNGVKAAHLISDGGGFVEGGVRHTAYLSDAAVESWFSPLVGLGWRFDDGGILKFNYSPDLGENDYTSQSVNLSFHVPF